MKSDRQIYAISGWHSKFRCDNNDNDNNNNNNNSNNNNNNIPVITKESSFKKPNKWTPKKTETELNIVWFSNH